MITRNEQWFNVEDYHQSWNSCRLWIRIELAKDMDELRIRVKLEITVITKIAIYGYR